MIDSNHALFLAEVVGILAMPGRPNSLLFVSGATRGLRAGLHLPVAEVTAYFITISLLLFVLGPAAEGYSIVRQFFGRLLYRRVWVDRSRRPPSLCGAV